MNWEQQNIRRCELIDREISGTITPEEEAELKHLQSLLWEKRRLNVNRRSLEE